MVLPHVRVEGGFIPTCRFVVSFVKSPLGVTEKLHKFR